MNIASIAKNILKLLAITDQPSDTIVIFRKDLKTDLFEVAFPPYIFGGFVFQW